MPEPHAVTPPPVVSTPSVKLRAIVVGTGTSAREKAAALRHHPAFDLAGVVDTVPEAMAVEADVAVICLAPTETAAAAETLLAASRHLLVDRPLAASTIDSNRVVSAAETGGLACAVTTLALAPAIRRVRTWVEAGHLGLPRSINVECLSSDAGWARAFGDAIDYTRALTGCEPVDVFVEAGSTGQDGAVSSIRFTHGVVASLFLGQVPVVPGTGAASTTIRLIGSHGHVELDTASPVVRLYSREGQRHLSVDTAPLTAVLDEFAASVRAGRRPAYDCRDAAIAVAATTAAYESIATGLPVTVPAGGRGVGST